MERRERRNSAASGSEVMKECTTAAEAGGGAGRDGILRGEIAALDANELLEWDVVPALNQPRPTPKTAGLTRRARGGNSRC